MAIYHAHVSSGSRAGGQSGAAKVAYVLREGKYARRDDLVVSGHGHLPAWAGEDPRALFAAADLHERANGRVFVEVEVALPHELSETQQHELVRSIAAAVTAPGLPYTYAIHAGRPKSSDELANPHVHIVISERVNDGVPRDAEQWFRRANKKRPELGGAAKLRSLKERTWVDDTRKLIARLINKQLKRAQTPARVTSDSHATRIARAVASGDMETAKFLRQHPPGIHLGPTLAALERDRFRQRAGEEPVLSRAGEPTGRGDRSRTCAVAAARVREGIGVVTTQLGPARIELQRATEAVSSARSAGLADEAILGIYEKAEAVERGSGWGAVEATSSSHAVRRRRAEAAAGELGIDAAAVFQGAAARGLDRVAALEQAVSVFTSARSARLTDTQVWRIHGEAESAEQGSGWVAVEAATAARAERKELAESGAAAAGITAGEIAAVYAAAASRDTDPVAALEAETATQVAASARRSARRTALFDAPGGREAYVAALTAHAADGDPGNLSGSDIDRCLGAAAEAEHLGRVRALFEDEAGRTYYRVAVRELGERYGMRQIADVVTAAEGFVGRVRGLSDVGHAVLDTVLGNEKDVPVAALETTLERAEEEERKESDRRRAAQRRAVLDRRAEGLRASDRGARWLREAEREVLAGGARRPTLDEWTSIVGTAEEQFSAELDVLEAALEEHPSGPALTQQLRSNRLGDDSSQLTLRAREDIIETAVRWLRAWERQEELFKQHDGKPLYYEKLTELDPGWRDTSLVRIGHVEQALEHGEAMLAGRARRAAALRERQLGRRLAALRAHEVGERFYTIKLDELGWRQIGSASPARRERAIEWAERQVARLDELRAHGAAGELTEVGSARNAKAVERAIDDAEARLAARRRKAAERARLAALDKEIARRREEVRACPAGDALLLKAGFGKSREQNVQVLGKVERSLAADFARREQVLTVAGGAAFIRAARREVLGADRAPATLGERSGVLAAAERSRAAAADRRAARHQLVSDTLGGAERLRAAGWREARTDRVRDRLLDDVEQALAADFARREHQVRSDEAGAACLRRGRQEILDADREPRTLVERGRVIERAETLQQAAVADRARGAANKQRLARLTRLFADAAGDEAFFAALDARKPSWRERGTAPGDIDHALDLAEQHVDRTQPATAEHVVVVNAQQAFSAAPSAAWRQAGDRFPKGSVHARVSQRLADRTQVCALAAEREEPPASSALVQRLFTWLRAQIDKLLERLGRVQPATRPPPPASGAAVPAQPVSASTPSAGTPSRSVGQAPAATDKPGHPQVAAGHRTDREEARRQSVSNREFVICRVPGGEERRRAEGHKILGGSSRRLSLEERESVASSVEAWIRTGVRADVDRVIGETRAAVGFAPPVQIWREVGHQLHQEKDYIPGSRPGLLISTLRTLPEGTADVPTDEKRTLQAALDEQRRAEAEERYRKALKVHQRDLQVWKDSGSLFRRRGWPKPRKPPKPKPESLPPTPEQVKKFRMDLTISVARIVRGRLEQMYSQQERARPLRPGERVPAPSPSRVPPQRQPGRGYDWSR